MEPPNRARLPLSGLLVVFVLSLGTGSALGCDCPTHKDGGAPPDNSLLPRGGSYPGVAGAPPRPSRPSTLDDVLTPELVQSYLALQLHRAALDMAERTQRTDPSRSPGVRCFDSLSPCGGRGGGPASLRRAKRFAAAARIDAASDIPVVQGLVGTGLSAQGSRALPSASPFLAVRPASKPPRDDSDDVPVFKGTREGTPVVHLVTPPPAAARQAPTATTVPTVPVVKGSADPAHPTTPRTALLPGDLQLTPEEEEALAVLLEGRHHKNGPNGPQDKPFRTRPAAPRLPRPPSRPAHWPSSTPALVGSVSGKVGGKASPAPASPPVASTQPPLRRNNANCCSQRRLVQELERQLTLLRQLNAEHMREEWVRASYPSPYYPYLHNLPVHSARGYEDGPMLVPTYYLPSGWRRRDPLLPLPSAWTSGHRRPAQLDPANCDGANGGQDVDVDDGGHLDDKVQFSEQQQRGAGDREVDDLRGADPHDDVGVDPKIGQPVDFEVRR